MKNDELKSTTPKPFVFVLMPFDPSFNDIFKFGIKGAAEDVGAHAERLDDQIFTEGMLDHIFNEISKADVIVADMTGRNPNVFYEVGYAHALGKIVLLLTQNSDDIPFDLKHRQHTVYGGSIEKLRKDLAEKLEWAIATVATKRERTDQALSEEGYFLLRCNDVTIYPSGIGISGPAVALNHIVDEVDGTEYWSLKAEMHNPNQRISPPVEYAYLYQRKDPALRYGGIKTQEIEDSTATDGLTHVVTLPWTIPPLPTKATHIQYVAFDYDYPFKVQEQIRIRLKFPDRWFDYPLMVEIK